jgi:diadenosine tetraphosphate (Ap4A) HIT family hydrolase
MFELDPRLASSTIEIANWSLCKVLLKNEANFFWLLLVPKRANITEIYQLSQNDQQRLIIEISQLSEYVKNKFQVDKINVAAIGNQVEQLHIHVVGRNKTDPLWPQSIWQPGYQATPHTDIALQLLVEDLQHALIPLT